MPSFDKIKVKHLNVEKSHKPPIKNISLFDSNLDSKESGTLYRVSGLNVSPVTLTLPHAKKGQLYSFYVTDLNTQNLTLSPRDGDSFTGTLFSSQGTFSISIDAYYTNSTILSQSITNNGIFNLNVSNYNDIIIKSNADVGTLVELVCLEHGTWFVSGSGFLNSALSTNLASVSTAVFDDS